MKEKIKLDDLYFGVMCPALSYSSPEDRGKLTKYNLFEFSRVKWSVATWVAMKEEDKKGRDFLRYCFGDTWGRCEFEMIICDWPYREGTKVEECGEKYDIFELYVKPNEALLRDMVNRVSVSSAKKYLTEYRKKFKK